MNSEHINSKIMEAKKIIGNPGKSVPELKSVSDELERRYKDALLSESVTYAMIIDLIETENKIDALMQPYTGSANEVFGSKEFINHKIFQ